MYKLEERNERKGSNQVNIYSQWKYAIGIVPLSMSSNL